MENKPKSESAAKAGDDLNETAGGVKDQIVEAAAEAKTKSVDQITGVSRAVHGAADELGRELPQAAEYIHSVADKLESASSALRERARWFGGFRVCLWVFRMPLPEGVGRFVQLVVVVGYFTCSNRHRTLARQLS
jgi:hypothetical protein